MSAFLWDASFATGLDLVDAQHHALVDLINRYCALQEAGKPLDPVELERVFDELSDYARYHFTEEQRFMDERAVDSRHVAHHVREHAEFFRDLARLRSDAAPRHIQEFLVHWLAAHILGVDQSMARQIAAMHAGKSPEDAFALKERLVEGSTEILIKSLNGLFRVVSEQSRGLFELNRDLESRVVQRTEELSAMNERLAWTVDRLQAEQKETQRLNEELSLANRNLEAYAMVDRLTGFPNLQYALHRLTSEIAAAKRFGHPLTLALFVAEGFRQIKDAQGHEVTERIILAMGDVLRRSFRAHDAVCQVGAEEFIVICPHTSYADASRQIKRVRTALAKVSIPLASGAWNGPVGVGIAEYGPSLDTGRKLIQAATTRLGAL